MPSLRLCLVVPKTKNLLIYGFTNPRHVIYNETHNKLRYSIIDNEILYNIFKITVHFGFFFQKMSEQITKLSQTLGRDAIYTKTVSTTMYTWLNLVLISYYIGLDNINCNIWIKYLKLIHWSVCLLATKVFVTNSQSKISRLPAYLTVQFVRFYYKEKESINAKILKDVKFPLELDVFELCSPELQERLAPMRTKFKVISLPIYPI